ncbi:MAG: hypothetical protein ACOYOE_03220 [Chlorobium sp.]
MDHYNLQAIIYVGLFLHLNSIRMEDALIERHLRRWLVMSILLGRYSPLS